MMTDPIADMLTRIRNAQMARKAKVEIPLSKFKKEIADILNQEGYVGEVIVKKEDKPAKLVVGLKYNGKKAAITSIKRESKPGHRRYCRSNDLPHVLNDYGLAIVSTSQGLMTNKEARKRGIGGEILCTVY